MVVILDQIIFVFKQKTAYEMRISDWSSDVCSSDLRAESDLRNEKINYKVREHSLAKVPYLLVVGKREAEEGTVAIRTLGHDGQRIMPLAEAIAMLKAEATPPDLKSA